MSDHNLLIEVLGNKPILLIDSDTGECRLIARNEMVNRIRESADVFATGIMMDLERAATNFGKLAGTSDRSFTIEDLTKITSLPYATLDSWVGKGLIIPSIRAGCGGGRGKSRLFSWADAFVAGMLASLRRQGVPVPMLRNVGRLMSVKSAHITEV